jgi:hypothetical protein
MSEKESKRVFIKRLTDRIIGVADQLLADDDDRLKLESPATRAITTAITESIEIDERQARN